MKFTTVLSAVLLMLTTFLASAVPLFAADTQLGDLTIAEPWARASIGVSRPVAAFFSVENKGDLPDRLIALSSSQAGMAEVHRTEMTDGVMKMKPAGPLEVPAGGRLELKPGGLHVMLMKLTEPLVKGETLSLELVFERAGRVVIAVPIYSAGAPGPE